MIVDGLLHPFVEQGQARVQGYTVVHLILTDPGQFGAEVTQPRILDWHDVLTKFGLDFTVGQVYQNGWKLDNFIFLPFLIILCPASCFEVDYDNVTEGLCGMM